MTFISYAQNFEDVMLWRALRDVTNGFWIDVGAAHPREGSVTLAFSERGWRGINIEPEPSYAAQLREERPRDVNLEVAVGARPARLALHHVAGTGLSTFDAGIAKRHEGAGYKTTGLLEVEVRTLADICAEHAPPVIHFLKIDAEGSEADVLRGADFTHYRPWIVVVEATAPFSPVKAAGAFEDLLFSAGYAECWFDGLNVFYLAAEQDARLRPSFAAPPNFFDRFVRADDPSSVARVAVLEKGFHDLEGALAACRAELAAVVEDRLRDAAAAQARAELLQTELTAALAAAKATREARDGLAAQLAGLEASLSWRITAPLRKLRASLRRN